MKARRLVLAGVGIAVVLGGTAVVLDQMTAGAQSVTRVAPAADSSPPSAGSTGDPGPSDAAAATEAGESAAAPATAPSAEPSAGSTPAPVGGREVLPPVSASPSGLPMPSPPSPLISMPLPVTASAQGKVVDGFPVDVFPFPEGTVVVSTSVSSAEGTLQVAADAIIGLSQDSVAGHFQQILGGLGFGSEPVPAAEGQRSIRFSRGSDSVTVTASTTGTGGTRFMLLGNLYVAAGR